MAAPVIKLEPIRMGDLINTSSSSSGYVAPHLRVGTTKKEDAIVGNNVTSFPALGTVQQKNVSTWKQVVHKAPVETPVVTEPSVVRTMNDKIKQIIHQSELEELERQKPREEDPEKMTREELLADGWVFLSLKSANEARLRLNSL